MLKHAMFTVSRLTCRNNTSDYYVNSKRVNVKEVTTLLKSKGIDLDNNRFLILQVCVGSDQDVGTQLHIYDDQREHVKKLKMQGPATLCAVVATYGPNLWWCGLCSVQSHNANVLQQLASSILELTTILVCCISTPANKLLPLPCTPQYVRVNTKPAQDFAACVPQCAATYMMFLVLYGALCCPVMPCAVLCPVVCCAMWCVCCQGEVEQISLMKPKAEEKGDTGLLEYLEDIIGTDKLIPQIEEEAKK